MPDVDGVTILRELRNRGDRLPVVLISGMTAGGDLSQELADPRTRFLAKPYTRNALQQILAGLLGEGATTPPRAPRPPNASTAVGPPAPPPPAPPASSRQTTNDDDSSFDVLA
jgi:DNA-binding NtrC family response regulator